MNETRRRFGPYLVGVDGNHCTISREDGEPTEPAFYEMHCMKNMAFGGAAAAVEVFPPSSSLVDGENQRHLWLVKNDSVPDLRTGHLVEHEEVVT